MGRADDDPTTPSSPDPSQVSPVRSSATLTAPSTQEPLGHDDVTAILPHRFRRMETLGRGGAGVVVAAHDTVLRRDVAIKFLHHLGEADIRLLEEARAAADLHHKSIVTIYDVDPQGRYIVMELVHGQTLQQRLQQRRTLSVPEIYTLGRTLLDALQAAHARGIIHRDVKPANILFDRENVIKLNDFGIAFRTNSDETPQIAGTPAYMAPEVWEGREPDARTDLFGVGITLWEASVGRKFRDGSSPEDFAATEVLASTRDPHLASVIARAIAPDRDQRYLSATEFARALYPSATRRMWRIGIAATFAVTAIILSVILAFREGPSVPAGPPTPRVVATLPFQDRTGQADVEFARTAVPSALAGELRHVQHLSLLLNEQLFERTRCPLALEDVRAWAACAMAAGATMLISGEIDKRGDRLRVEITVSHLDGTRLGALIAETSSSGLIALVRRHAHEIAALIDGRRAGEITIDPDLDLGVEALHQQSFETARRHLEAAWARDPSVPDPLFYLAILDYWEDRSPDDATLARVLAAPLTATQRGILIGFARLSRFELEPALLHFRALADQEPTNPLVSYGLFEALFHGGYPADGISRYRQLAESDRDFRVGLVHAFDYYTAHHDAEGVVWALARAQQVSSALSTEYQIRLRVMNGDLSGATSSLISELDEAERRGTSPPYMQGVLALGMVRDDFGTVDRVRIHMGAPQTDLAIAIWRGQPEDARVALSKVIASARSRGRNGAHDIARVAILASLADDISLSSLALAAIDELLATTPHHTTNEQLARAFLLARLGRRAELARYQSSGIPELARIARALRSNLDGAVAADDWRQAFALSADGQYVLGGKLHLARMLHAQKDLKRVLELCAQILAPRTLDPALGVGSVACAVWSGQAAEQMGKRDQALELYRRVVRVRSSTDSMHQLALDGLRRLGS